MKDRIWQPNFFRAVPHPYITNNDNIQTNEEVPIYYQLIQNEDGCGNKGYWERRENGEWDDMPNLWGPF